MGAQKDVLIPATPGCWHGAGKEAHGPWHMMHGPQPTGSCRTSHLRVGVWHSSAVAWDICMHGFCPSSPASDPANTHWEAPDDDGSSARVLVLYGRSRPGSRQLALA